jgi:transposase InsO family protein
VYRFIEDNKDEFGLRWLFRRCNIYPNGYYNYLKHRKQAYQDRKDEVCTKIAEIYHQHGGVPGYRMMKILIERQNIFISNLTAHKYMNTYLELFSVVRRKKPSYKKGAVNEVLPNLLQQNFYAPKPNKIWCTDFTYLPLIDGSMRYNCTIIDMFDRSVVASVTGKNITSQLAAETLGVALNSQPRLAVKGVILHSDQGSQFTSKEFTEFCKANGVTQSMSRAGCPYDNAPMERYYNTLKNKMIYHHYFHSEEQLYLAVSDFAFLWYNHIRPHTFNKGKTPLQKRYSA